MSAVDQHAEAHRLKAECGYGARRIAAELGISRHAATLLLSRPLAEPVAETVAGGGRPVAAVAATDGQERRPVAEPVAEVAEQLAGPRPLPQRVAQPLEGIDVSQCRGLRRDLAVLAQTGRSAEELVYQAVAAVAFHYRQALGRGDIEVGQPFQIREMTLRPVPVAGLAPKAG